MPRGRVEMVREPASGVALAMCYLARMFPTGMGDLNINSYHPAECRFCDLSDDELFTLLDDFNTWAGVKDDRPVPAPVLSFLTLPADEQSRLVRKQALIMR